MWHYLVLHRNGTYRIQTGGWFAYGRWTLIKISVRFYWTVESGLLQPVFLSRSWNIEILSLIKYSPIWLKFQACQWVSLCFVMKNRETWILAWIRSLAYHTEAQQEDIGRAKVLLGGWREPAQMPEQVLSWSPGVRHQWAWERWCWPKPLRDIRGPW